VTPENAPIHPTGQNPPTGVVVQYWLRAGGEDGGLDLLEILESEDGRGTRGILHSFTESAEVALRLIELGYFISFSGIITFKSADALREAARRLPPERVLIETDTPYLAPAPFRGRPNEPAFVGRVAEQLAALWNLPPEEVAERTTTNFETAFRVKIPA